MKQTSEWMNERVDNDILFSKAVKAGKRVYYFDVKRDRREALYLSITESKRVKDGRPEDRPVFEKHKIFLYREDMEKFLAALTAATGFAIENSPVPEFDAPVPASGEWGNKPEDYFVEASRESEDLSGDTELGGSDSESLSGGKIKIDMDFL